MSLELKPKSKLYEFLKEAALARKRYSEQKMCQYSSRWDDADDQFQAYIPTKELDEAKKKGKKYAGEVDYVTLELPYTYATLMSAHTYWTTVFLSRNPVYQLTARHGEGQDKVMAMEAVLDYQKTVGEHVVPLFNWLFDAAKYGFGVTGEYWEKETVVFSRLVEKQDELYGSPYGPPKRKKETRVMTGYEGNRLYNVRPYDWLPDPRVPMAQFQKGEFCGRKTTISHSQLHVAGLDGKYVNVDLAKKTKGSSMQNRDPGSPRVELPYGISGDQVSAEAAYNGESCYDVLEMYIRIIPKEWKLGKGERPEIWVFTLINDETLVEAAPLGLIHGKYPFNFIESMFGNDAFIKVNTAEVMKPMSDVMTWLINSHFYNVRKALNDVRVVDPSRVNMNDVRRPQPGGAIRLKPTAYGTDVREAIHQLDVKDMTRTHLQDTVYVEQMLQKVTGVMDNIMGQLSSGGRKTATEVRTAGAYSSNRLKTVSEYFSAMGWQSMVAKMIMSTQQLMEEERQFKIAGNTIQGQTEEFLTVDPEEIYGFYDYVPVDGSLPVDRLAQSTFWKDLIVQLARAPAFMQEWDINGMIAYTMQLQGERNIDRFRIQAKPPEVIESERAKGNIVPIAGGKAPGSAGNPTGVGTLNPASGV